MSPFSLPPGTTLESLITSVLPAEHRQRADSNNGARYRILFALEGQRSAAWVLDIRGNEITVTEERGLAPEGAYSLRVQTAHTSAWAFLADWLGEKTLLPKALPPEGAPSVPTDPRVLQRICAVTGSIEVALRDFPIDGKRQRVSLVVAAGSTAKKPYYFEEPDVVVETSMATFMRILAAELTPDAALADGDVSVRGKKLVALQFAFAVAPFQYKGAQ